ncbi:hypothetical protein MKX03_036039 [Papaver bracteatum]|nr:hypothetical protein MKX03_036039 [Papaver bracteatum]
MNREPANKSMGFFAIYKEAYKLTELNKKFFLQITLTLPFSMFYIVISTVIHTKTYPEKETSRQIDYGLTKSIYFILALFLTILSTSSVMHTHKKVIGVLQKCWERLIFTFFWSFFMEVIYSPVALGLLLCFFRGVDDLRLSDPYFTGLIYMLVVLNVATAIMLLEKDDVIKASAKSVRLIFGKIWISCAVYGLLEIAFTGIILPCCYLVVYGNKMNLVVKVFVRIGCYLMTIIWIHFSLVRLAVVYLVFKSYYNEDIPTVAATHAAVVPIIHLVFWLVKKTFN